VRRNWRERSGYGDLIMEQIWEVWSWGKDKTEDLKGKDEDVVKVKKEHKDEGLKK